MRIYNNLGYGIHLWNEKFNSDRNIIRNNIVYNNGTAQGQCGILYSGGSDGLVYNNVVYSNGGGGICIESLAVGGRQQFPVTIITIAN